MARAIVRKVGDDPPRVARNARRAARMRGLRLGSRIAARFEKIGLDVDLIELRGARASARSRTSTCR